MKPSFLFLPLLFGLVDCSFAAPQISCSAPGTQEIVKQTFTDHIVNSLKSAAGVGNSAQIGPAIQAVRSLDISLNAIRTEAHDASINKYDCQADFVVGLPPATIQAVQGSPLMMAALQQDGVEVTNRGVAAPVSYTSQLTDDKQQQYVTASGLQPLADAVNTLVVTPALEAQTQDATTPSGPTARDGATADTQSPESSPAGANGGPAGRNTSSVEKTGICKGLDMSITSEQLQCLDMEFSAADKRLNQDYKHLMAKLDATQKSALKRNEIAWIKEKREKCGHAGDQFKGGSMEQVVVRDCEVQMTKKRAEYLEHYR